MSDFAMVRVRRARDNDVLQLRVEVSSDGGDTWKSLPIATPSVVEATDGAVTLHTSLGSLPCVQTRIAIVPELGGAIELDKEGLL